MMALHIVVVIILSRYPERNPLVLSAHNADLTLLP